MSLYYRLGLIELAVFDFLEMAAGACLYDNIVDAIDESCRSRCLACLFESWPQTKEASVPHPLLQKPHRLSSTRREAQTHVRVRATRNRIAPLRVTTFSS